MRVDGFPRVCPQAGACGTNCLRSWLHHLPGLEGGGTLHKDGELGAGSVYEVEGKTLCGDLCL